MKQRHKHADAIIAWAEGAEVERRANPHAAWERAIAPSWLESCEYRIKPPTKKYRVALFRDCTEGYTSTADSQDYADIIEQRVDFVRWLTDWIEYEE